LGARGIAIGVRRGLVQDSSSPPAAALIGESNSRAWADEGNAACVVTAKRAWTAARHATLSARRRRSRCSKTFGGILLDSARERSLQNLLRRSRDLAAPVTPGALHSRSTRCIVIPLPTLPKAITANNLEAVFFPCDAAWLHSYLHRVRTARTRMQNDWKRFGRKVRHRSSRGDFCAPGSLMVGCSPPTPRARG